MVNLSQEFDRNESCVLVLYVYIRSALVGLDWSQHCCQIFGWLVCIILGVFNGVCMM